MKLQKSHTGAFSLSEMMVAVAIGIMILGVTLSASVSLQKSLSAAEHFFSTHIQQVRIIDYLSRDVKRSTIVNASADQQTVTCTIPNYIIQPGDPDAGTGNVNIGKRRTPTVTITANGAVVNYGATSSTVVYSVNGLSIVRTENGVVTTIASSTDQLIAKGTDITDDLRNTEYLDSNVTFLPTFNFNPNINPSATPSAIQAKRDGTAIFAKSYLRNKRRG